MKTDMHAVRVRAAKWLSVTTLGFGLATLCLGMILPVNSIWPGVVALGFAMLTFLGWRLASNFGFQLIGLGMMGQSMAFTKAFEATSWQIDAHFSFLAFLALLVSLYNVRVILVATAAIVVHHLVYGMVFPQFVFPSTDVTENLLRAAFHAVLVVILDAGLIISVRTRLQMEDKNAAALDEARKQTEAAAAASAKTEAALEEARAQQSEAERAASETKKMIKTLEDAEAARVAANEASREAEARQAAERAEVAQEQAQVVDVLRAGLSRFADGDFSQPMDEPLPPAYESLRSDYNKALEQLNASLKSLSAQTSDLRAQVATINASASDLAQRTERQVVALEQTTNAVKDLNASVRGSAENAGETSKAAQAIQADAKAGSQVVERAVEAMTEIQDSSNEIAKINALIDGIAFQTNLLALNAGVEAARAGEAGRGFAVVASEVRALSQRTTEAANDIGELVARSQNQVQSGASLVQEAGERLSGIVDGVEGIARSIKHIADETGKQASGLDQVNSAVSDLDGVAQSNAAMFEETSAACAFLDDGMDRMREEISMFQTARTHETPPAAAKAG